MKIKTPDQTIKIAYITSTIIEIENPQLKYDGQILIPIMMGASIFQEMKP